MSEPTLDLSDEAIIKRIFARYYNHIEDLGIVDADRRAQLALDLGFLIGFAFRSLSASPAKGAAVREEPKGLQSDHSRGQIYRGR